MKYILASDYEGTISRHGVISEKTVSAIREFRSKGNLFGVVTGRDYVNGFEEFKNSNKFPFDFIIANNGAAAYDKDGNIYFSKTVNTKKSSPESKIAQKLIKRCMQLTSNPCGISFEKARFDFHPDFPLLPEEEKLKYSPISVLDDVREFVLANAICDTSEEAEKAVRILKEEFGEYVNPMQNDRCIDISPAGIDKSVGIELLAECLKVPLENVWTVGDNFNDAGMIQKYNGCAIISGVNDIKKIAKYVCDDVADVIEIIMKKQQ